MNRLELHQDENNGNSRLWSWFIEECNNDLERRRDVYCLGETLMRKEIRGDIAQDLRRKSIGFAEICLFLPHPVPTNMGPLNYYLSHINNVIAGLIPDGGQYFNAGPVILPFFPWSYDPGHQISSLHERIQILLRRIREEKQRLERPDLHLERSIYNYFGTSGVEPALTLALSLYLSHFHLRNFDVFHLYTALLFSGDILKKFERKFVRINQAIKKDILRLLRNVIAEKHALSLPHTFETQSLQLMRTRKVQEVFLYVHQYGNNAELRRLLDDRISMGPHFFFKIIWNGVPFNRLFLGFIRLRPTDLHSFKTHLLSIEGYDNDVMTSHFSQLQVHGTPYIKPLEFLKENCPVRRGCRTDRSLVEGKVLTLKSSFALPNRDLNWEEEMLLTCSTPNNVIKDLVSVWKKRYEYKQINSFRVSDDELSEHIPNEGLQLWKRLNSNTRNDTESEVIEVEVSDKKTDVYKINLTADFYSYISYPLDVQSKLIFSLMHPMDPPSMLDRIEIRNTIEDVVTTILQNQEFDENDYLAEEIWAGDMFEKELYSWTNAPLFEWLEETLMNAEDIRSNVLSWNRSWRLKPFCEPYIGNISSILDQPQKTVKNEIYEEEKRIFYLEECIEEEKSDSDQLNNSYELNLEEENNRNDKVNYDKGKNFNEWNYNAKLNHDKKQDYNFEKHKNNGKDETSVKGEKANKERKNYDIPQQIEPISILRDKAAYPKRKWNDRHKEQPYWLPTIWKRIMWINWRGRNELWLGNNLNNIDYLIQRNVVLKHMSIELKKYETVEQYENDDQSIETGSYTSLISESTISSANLALGLLTEPFIGAMASASTISSLSSYCEYGQYAYRAKSRWEFSSPPPFSDRHLMRTVTFFEMYDKILKQKEEILSYALEKRALSVVPRKLYVDQQIRRCIKLFLVYETNILSRLSGVPASSIISNASNKSLRRTVSSLLHSRQHSIRHSTILLFSKRNYLDLGHWLAHIQEQISHSKISLLRNRMNATLKSLDHLKKQVLEKFLSEVTHLEKVMDSFRWKLSIKHPIRCRSAFLNLCCWIAPIRNATYLCSLLFQSSSVKRLILKSEIPLRHQSYRVRRTHSLLSSARFKSETFKQLFNQYNVKKILFQKVDIVRKWPIKKKWPRNKECTSEELEMYWLDSTLLGKWQSSYSSQILLKKLLALRSLRHCGRLSEYRITQQKTSYSSL